MSLTKRADKPTRNILANVRTLYYTILRGAIMIANINIKIDSELKKQAEALFTDLGMNMTTALNIFMRQAVRENRIPFEITRDPYSLEKAVSDSRNRTNLHGPFSSAEDAVASMLED